MFASSWLSSDASDQFDVPKATTRCAWNHAVFWWFSPRCLRIRISIVPGYCFAAATSRSICTLLPGRNVFAYSFGSRYIRIRTPREAARIRASTGRASVMRKMSTSIQPPAGS